MEQSFDNDLARRLIRAGHDILVKAEPTAFGRGEIIWLRADGSSAAAVRPAPTARLLPGNM